MHSNDLRNSSNKLFHGDVYLNMCIYMYIYPTLSFIIQNAFDHGVLPFYMQIIMIMLIIKEL